MGNTNGEWISNSGLSYEITKDVNAKEVWVRFLKTGYEYSTTRECAKSGQVKDPTQPSIYGVGFIGVGVFRSSEKGIPTRCYKTWLNMLKRCYDEKSLEKRPTYKGCTVCDEWHNFQNFAQWYSDNYPSDNEIYQIDKDLSSYGKRGKLYSPSTCVFVSAQVNTEECRAKMWDLLSPKGEKIQVYNLAKFCRENGLDRGSMCKMYSGKATHHKGWKKNA